MDSLQSLFLSNTNPVVNVLRGLYRYLRLGDYLKYKYTEFFNPDFVHEISAYGSNSNVGEASFWEQIFQGKIKLGDYVKLSNFQLSTWFPRKPGVYWTMDAARARHYALKHLIESENAGSIVFNVEGKEKFAEFGGYGSVNFRKDRDNILITATSSGYCDRGIPLLVTKQVWEKIFDEIKRFIMVEIDLMGILVEIPTDYNSQLLRNSGTSRIAIYIDNIHNLKVKQSDHSIWVTPWTIFETHDSQKPFGFTFVNHQLYRDSFEHSVSWMMGYIDKHSGKSILTDFDETTNSLGAQFPLENIGVLDPEVNSKLLKYLQKKYKDFNFPNNPNDY